MCRKLGRTSPARYARPLTASVGPRFDLSARLGVPSAIDDATGEIEFGVPVVNPTERSMDELIALDVRYQRNASLRACALPAARMYRLINDAAVLEAQGLNRDETFRGVKFDVTVLPRPDADSGSELPKTVGHYHTPVSGFRLASPDLYQVAHGHARILLQSPIHDGPRSFFVDLQPGEAVLIPPQFGHVTINIGHSALAFANVCVRQPHLDYEPYFRHRGGTYYFVRGEHNTVQAVRNPAYSANSGVSMLRLAPVRRALADLGLSASKPIYGCITDAAPILAALCEPDGYEDLFNAVLCVVDD